MFSSCFFYSFDLGGVYNLDFVVNWIMFKWDYSFTFDNSVIYSFSSKQQPLLGIFAPLIYKCQLRYNSYMIWCSETQHNSLNPQSYVPSSLPTSHAHGRLGSDKTPQPHPLASARSISLPRINLAPFCEAEAGQVCQWSDQPWRKLASCQWCRLVSREPRNRLSSIFLPYRN